jgi:hypothetical protein
MSAVTGTFRNGRIELHGPPPADWVDGTEVSVDVTSPAGEIDLTGDSPEAIAAWVEAMAEVHKLTAGSTFPEELEAILAEDKRQELARWEEESKRAEGVFK